jgi:hypothetical protein
LLSRTLSTAINAVPSLSTAPSSFDITATMAASIVDLLVRPGVAGWRRAENGLRTPPSARAHPTHFSRRRLNQLVAPDQPSAELGS